MMPSMPPLNGGLDERPVASGTRDRVLSGFVDHAAEALATGLDTALVDAARTVGVQPWDARVVLARRAAQAEQGEAPDVQE